MNDRRRLKRLCALAGLLALVFACDRVMAYFVMPQTNTIPLVVQDRDAWKGRIDTVILGSSLSMEGIDPDALDAALGCTSFNLASVAQSMQFSLFALKDALADNPVSRVLVEVSVARLTREEQSDEGVAQIDRIRSPGVRWAYAWAACGLDRLPEAFSVTMRCQLRYLLQGYDQRLSPKYLLTYLKNGGYVLPKAQSSAYQGRGFTAYYGTFAPEHDKVERVASDAVCMIVERTGDAMDPIDYLSQLVALCGEKNIEVALIALPESQARLAAFEGGYAAAHEAMQSLASELGVTLYDFNEAALRPNGLSDDLFKDAKHLNDRGAARFTRALAQTLSRDAA